MKFVVVVALLVCSALSTAAQGDFIPEPRGNLTVVSDSSDSEKPFIPIPRASEWQTYSFSSYSEVVRMVSSNYPFSYNPGEYSRVMFYAPFGSIINVNCAEINVEKSNGCIKDGIHFSKTGRTDFADGIGMCGSGAYRLSSSTNRLAFKFTSNYPQSESYNFRFSCTFSISKSTTIAAPTITTTKPLSTTTTTTAAPTTTTTTAAPTTTTTKPHSTTATHLAPPETAPGTSTKSSNCDCGAISKGARIVGGTEAKLNEFPWRCVMYTSRLGAFCGATVIDNEWILTAAHCTTVLNSTDKLWVDCGDHDLSTTSESRNQMVPVDHIVRHPQYTTPSQNNDIGLLHLAKPLTYSREVSPVCLPWQQQGNQCRTSGTSVVASGWGTTSYQGSPSMNLMKVEMPCMSSTECSNYYRGMITSNQICTLSSGQDACQGDSGGSIDYKDPNTSRYYTIGVVSWGDECAKPNRPGVYSNVVNYLDWIKSTTGKTFCGQ